MQVIQNQVSITREELDHILATGRFLVSEHTEYYMHHIRAEYCGISIGFYNWLENLDCYTAGPDEGDETRVLIRDDLHLQQILTAMDALMALRNRNLD